MKFLILAPLAALAALFTGARADNLSFTTSVLTEGDVSRSFLAEEGNHDAHGLRGGQASPGARLDKLERQLSAMYTSLPKNSKGKLGHQVVRYALHRFFVSRYGWFIRGLEPTNETVVAGKANPQAHDHEHMKEWIPSYLQDLSELRFGRDGADLSGLAVLAAALEDVVRLETDRHLQVAYHMHGWPHRVPLAREQAMQVLDTYYVGFLLAGDFSVASPKDLAAEKRSFVEEYPAWAEADRWLQGLAQHHLLQREDGLCAYEAIADVADLIGQTYREFNDKECDDLKATMKQIMAGRPGRVRLPMFYQTGMYSHWGFTEKREYLRALGALDETDSKRPYVIIANYAMARTNCLDASGVFTICCRNECEDLMQRLEGEIGRDTATPRRIAGLVSHLPSRSAHAPRELPTDLVERLGQVAAVHGGQVPLHGRLFAQWMHHAYPMECPYPQERGAINPQTPSEWLTQTGQETVRASQEEMLLQQAKDECAPDAIECAEDTAIPWDSTEELLTLASEDVAVRAQLLAMLPLARRARGLLLPLAGLAAILGVAAAARLLRRRRLMVHEEGQENNSKEDRRHPFAQVRDVLRQPIVVLCLLAAGASAVGLLDHMLFLCVLAVGGVGIATQRVGSLSAARRRRDAPEAKAV